MLLSILSSCLKDNDIQPSDTNLFVATEVNRTVTQIALVDEMTIDDEVFNASLEFVVRIIPTSVKLLLIRKLSNTFLNFVFPDCVLAKQNITFESLIQNLILRWVSGSLTKISYLSLFFSKETSTFQSLRILIIFLVC